MVKAIDPDSTLSANGVPQALEIAIENPKILFDRYNPRYNPFTYGHNEKLICLIIFY